MYRNLGLKFSLSYKYVLKTTLINYLFLLLQMSYGIKGRLLVMVIYHLTRLSYCTKDTADNAHHRHIASPAQMSKTADVNRMPESSVAPPPEWPETYVDYYYYPPDYSYEAVDYVDSKDDSCIEDDHLVNVSLDGCSSCSGRCGDLNQLSREAGLCSCDKACMVHGDCCPDVYEMCPTVYTLSLELKLSFPYVRTECLGKFVDSYSTFPIFYNFVVSCPNLTEICNTVDAYFDANKDIPVLDVDTGIYYVNNNCAECNGAKTIEPMQFTIYFPAFRASDWSFSEARDIVSNDTIDGVMTNKTNAWKGMGTPIVYVFHSDGNITMPRKCAPDVIETCQMRCENTTLSDRCELSGQSYTLVERDRFMQENRPLTYKNVYCALCGFRNRRAMRCGDYHIEAETETPVDGDVFSLSLLFDLSGMPSQPLQCSTRQMVLPGRTACITIKCPRRYILFNGTCLAPPTSTLSFQVNININCRDPANIEAINQFIVIQKLLEHELKTALSDSYDFWDICMHIVVPVEEYAWNATVEINATLVGVDIAFRERRILVDNCTSIISRHSRRLAKYYDCVDEVIFLNMVSYFPKLTRTTCAGAWLNRSDFHMRNRSLIDLLTGHIYHENFYALHDGGAFICYNTQHTHGSVSFTSTGIGITTIVISLLSLVCLISRMILQIWLKKYNNAPGKMQCQLSLALSLSIVLLLLSPMAAELETLCAVVAAFKYYAFLVSFSWMSCIAFDIWWTLQKASDCVPPDPDRSLKTLSLISWSIPAMVAIGLYCIDIAFPMSMFSPTFGGLVCWMVQKEPIILYFYIPLAISMFANLGFFILTSISLHSALKHGNETRSTRHSNKENKIYIKLFMLMGLTWASAFVATWLDKDIVWYIFVILNSSQGIFIFWGSVLDNHFKKCMCLFCCKN